jgi:nicrotizing toxin Mtb-like protein
MSQPGERLRKARLFDGEGSDGRPYASRPPVAADERDRLLAYLEKAPIALADNEFEADRLDPAGRRDVPMTFHTDGTWIWPGAVGYYLRHHDVAPEPDLVEHIRGRDYRLPDVDIRTRAAAVSAITGVSLPAPASVPASGREQQPPREQVPFEPVAGEPPLSLFRDLRMVELPVGVEVDRVGDVRGNVMYEARTPFENRSLPPEWMSRPYHVYRLQRPLQVLTGVAVPWFEQPGGGVAYVLPRPVRDLLTDGTLVEIAFS